MGRHSYPPQILFGGDSIKQLSIPSRIKPGSNRHRRYKFWSWYLTTAVLNLFNVDNMDADMETCFKLSVLCGGRVCFFKRGDTLYCLPFADGGEVPIYPGEIVRVIVTNPVLGEFMGTPGIDCECVYLTPLDRVQSGTGYSLLIDETADALTDNDLTIRCVQFAKRIPTVFVGHTDPERIAMECVMQQVEDGEPKILAQSPLNKSVERLDSSASNTSPLSEFTEYQQYKLGQFYTMLGVNSPWNTKRERVQAAENDANGETARYNIADVIDSMNQQLNRVNEMFGTNYHANLTLIKSAEIDAEIADKTGGESDADTHTDTTENDTSAETS